MKQFNHYFFAAAVGLFAVLGSRAATITDVGLPPAGELTQIEIIGQLLGGTITQTGNDFSNGSVDLTRVDDDSDQAFDIGHWTSRALFSFSDDVQAFGTASQGKLFDAVGSHGPVTGSASGPGGDGVVFGRFAYRDFFTDPSLNEGGRDHVITYTYTTEEGKTAYLLFFEDNNQPDSDYDYNDLVVEVIDEQSAPAIPEPGSLALVGLGAVVILYRRR